MLLRTVAHPAWPISGNLQLHHAPARFMLPQSLLSQLPGSEASPRRPSRRFVNVAVNLDQPDEQSVPRQTQYLGQTLIFKDALLVVRHCHNLVVGD
jgi:hypothetical protein